MNFGGRRTADAEEIHLPEVQSPKGQALSDAGGKHRIQTAEEVQSLLPSVRRRPPKSLRKSPIGAKPSQVECQNTTEGTSQHGEAPK